MKPLAHPKSSLVLSIGAAFLAASGTGLVPSRDPAPERSRASAPDGRAAPIFCAPGLTEPASEVIALRAGRSGRLAEVAVRSGDPIRVGQVLAVLEHDELDASVAAAEAEAAFARARLAERVAGPLPESIESARAFRAALDQDLEAAEAALRESRAGARPEELARARASLAERQAETADAARRVEEAARLVPRGALHRTGLDEAATALAVASARQDGAAAEIAILEAGARPERLSAMEAAVRGARARSVQAQAEYELLVRGARAEELDALRAALRAAEARLAGSVADREDAFVRSPLDGAVLYRHRHPGEQVGPSDPTGILEVATVSPLSVRAEVDEFDVAKVREGQAVDVTAPAFPELRIAGRVVRIERLLGRRNVRSERPTERKDSKVLEVVIELEGAEATLPVGMPVEVWFLDGDHPGK